MKTYLKTHPWLTFSLDLTRAPVQLWLLLGEAISKCEHLSGVALDPPTASNLMKIYLAKGALATTAIEGNTLTEEEALKRVNGIHDLPPSKEYLGQEIDNIIAASNAVLKACKKGCVNPVTVDLIKEYNLLVLKDLELEEHVVPGKVRQYSVGVADYRGAPAGEVDGLLDELVDWLRQPWITSLDGYNNKECKRLDAILKAVVFHVYLAWIHPFGDGNGRTARLVEFHILAMAGLPFPAAHLLSNHYNATRSDYYRQLSAASKSGGNIIPFIVYAVRGFVDQLREEIGEIRKYQLSLFWNNYVQQLLGDSETGRRRKYLVQDLSASAKRFVKRSELQEISVRVYRHYEGKNEKTLQRDLNALEELGLIIKEGEKFAANKDVVLAYLPPMNSEV